MIYKYDAAGVANAPLSWDRMTAAFQVGSDYSDGKIDLQDMEKIQAMARYIATLLLSLHTKYQVLSLEDVKRLQAVESGHGYGLSTALDQLQVVDSFVRKLPVLVPEKSAIITSHFGARKISKRRVKYHKGLDMVCKDLEVRAAADAVVASCSRNKGYGNLIILDHGLVKTKYAHLKSISVKVGDHVMQGQSIGIEGRTGNSIGYHPFEVLRSDSHLNPVNFTCHTTGLVQVATSDRVLIAQKSKCGQAVAAFSGAKQPKM